MPSARAAPLKLRRSATTSACVMDTGSIVGDFTAVPDDDLFSDMTTLFNTRRLPKLMDLAAKPWSYESFSK
jgi:hypothetical protein